ncbi:glycosyltransferase involved in cell wall biosynthesis [Arcticibacter pallidicorallinus]|uniref:Glycosyltransferase involved in cell wall biosynthesis n=1 Tax=Arcticibacter pallidicorallinus TaxID=1259464 RepID=A0A2T0UBH1_9SPHI|nr:glycosyltransferase family 4 protein [Arcticibacter pallidicorallinus]PRY55291.1 glycosyltransferase involved in cell wall biosynthesis [Arcticibacter pallidicorallinus]
MKEILLLTYNLKFGGAQQHLVLFANYLKVIGVPVVIVNVSDNNDMSDRLLDGIEIINIPRRYNFDLKPSVKIKKLIKDREIGHVFCNSLYCYLFVFRLNEVKRSVIFHTTVYTDNYSYLKDFFTRFLLQKDVRLVTVSNNQLLHLSKTLLIRKERFSLVYNGIDPQAFNYQIAQMYDRDSIRRELGIPTEAFVIIQVARYDVEKNHELSIAVLNILRSKHNIDAYMIFVGGNGIQKNRKEAITSLIEEQGLSNYIKVLGIQKDVKSFLAASDLFILTSKAVETFSIAALEAMAMGLPCVLTDVGGANEMIFTGKNGYLSSFSDAADFADKAKDVFLGRLEWTKSRISEEVIKEFNSEKSNSSLLKVITAEY